MQTQAADAILAKLHQRGNVNESVAAVPALRPEKKEKKMGKKMKTCLYRFVEEKNTAC